MLLVCSAASVAVALVRQHHRQQQMIKITAVVQLVAGKLPSFICSSFSIFFKLKFFESSRIGRFSWLARIIADNGTGDGLSRERDRNQVFIYTRKRKGVEKRRRIWEWQKQAKVTILETSYRIQVSKLAFIHRLRASFVSTRKDVSKGVQTMVEDGSTILHHSSEKKLGKKRGEERPRCREKEKKPVRLHPRTTTSLVGRAFLSSDTDAILD